MEIDIAYKCNIEFIRTSISYDEVVNIAVGVRIPCLKGKHVSIRRCIQLYDRLHWQRPIYEVRWLVINVLHVDNDTLIVRVCNRPSIYRLNHA